MTRIGGNEFDEFETRVIQYCVATYRAIGNPTTANIDDHPLAFHRLKADFDTERVMAALRRLVAYGWMRRQENMHGKTCPRGLPFVGYCVEPSMVEAVDAFEKPDYVTKLTTWARGNRLVAGFIVLNLLATSLYGLVSMVQHVMQ